jgi:hypothetical protein
MRVERDGMYVDLTAVARPQDGSRRAGIVRELVTERGERSDRESDFIQRHDDIEIAVLAVLRAEKRVDAPAAVQPHCDTDIVQCGEHDQ